MLHQDLGRNIVVDERAPSVLWLSFNKTEGNTGEILAAPTATFGVASATITTVEQGAVQEVQVISVSGATGGTFRLVHDTTATEAMPFDASPDQMEVAIGRLPSLGKVKVKLEEADRVWSVTFVSLPGQRRSINRNVVTHRWHGLRRDASRWHLAASGRQDQGRVRRLRLGDDLREQYRARGQ